MGGLNSASAATVSLQRINAYLVNENHLSTLLQHFLIVLPLSPHQPQPDKNTEPSTRSLVQTVRVSAGFRPGYVSAPYSAPIGLGLLSHEEASVRLIPYNDRLLLFFECPPSLSILSTLFRGSSCKELRFLGMYRHVA